MMFDNTTQHENTTQPETTTSAFTDLPTTLDFPHVLMYAAIAGVSFAVFLKCVICCCGFGAGGIRGKSFAASMHSFADRHDGTGKGCVSSLQSCGTRGLCTYFLICLVTFVIVCIVLIILNWPLGQSGHSETRNNTIETTHHRS